VLWPEHGSAPLTPTTFRASAGAVEHARLCRVRSLSGALLEAAQRELQVIGLDAQAPHALSELDLTRPTVLVVGAEDSGLSSPVRRACSSLASVVQTRKMDSLNASAAAAVALYETHRQRSASDPK
jgi:23S rRNA (guanosine2251-2'-O)-methyltransferase